MKGGKRRAGFRRTAGLGDDQRGIAEKNDVLRAEVAGDIERIEQGVPFGLVVGAVADSAAVSDLPARGDGGFHGAGVGAAAAVEEQLERLFRHRAARGWRR